LRFTKIVFYIAGVWGLAVLTPFYFLFDLVGRRYPPAITHPDFYYGFVGLGLAWQVVFLVIAKDPIRFHPMMVPALLEKLGYVISVGVLNAQGRLHGGQLVGAGADLALGILFVAAFLKTPARVLIEREKN
jgi:hypothetical protein